MLNGLRRIRWNQLFEFEKLLLDDKPTFLDFKLYDIPETVCKAIRNIGVHWPTVKVISVVPYNREFTFYVGEVAKQAEIKIVWVPWFKKWQKAEILELDSYL